MKASVQVFKKELTQHPGLEEDLSSCCLLIQDFGDVIEYKPKEGQMMNFICMLLDHQIAYRLNFEQKSVSMH